MQSNTPRVARRAISENQDVNEAVEEIKTQLGDDEYVLVTFFASPTYNPKTLSARFQEAFPNAKTIGCTTAGEILGGEIFKDSIVAMAFDKNTIKNASIYVIENSKDLNETNKAFNYFEKDLSVDKKSITEEKYVGIILTDGLSFPSEKIIDRINDLTNVSFIGGSAGDNWKMEHTYVFANGKAYEKSAVLILLEPTVGYRIFKTLAFKPIGTSFKVTKSDETTRCLKTINNKTAGLFYAEQIGKPLNEIKENIEKHTMGIMINNEAYVHDIKNFDANNYIYLYSAIPENAEVQILEGTDIIAETKSFINKNFKPIKTISGIIAFTCANRIKKVLKEGLSHEHKEIFKEYPIVGFGTYGEFYISYINHNAIFLVLL